MTRLPTLKRFDVTVWQNRSAGDPSQVPASSTIDFYLQDATVKIAATLSHPPAPEPVEVTVYDIGTLLASVSVHVNTNPNTLILVAWTDVLAGKVGLINLSGATINLVKGDRLVNRNNRPSIFRDPLGLEPIGTSIPTDSATGGRAEGYIAEYRFDYIIDVTSSDRRLYPDAVGSFEMSS